MRLALVINGNKYCTEVAQHVYRLSMPRAIQTKIFDLSNGDSYEALEKWASKTIGSGIVVVELELGRAGGKIEGTKSFFDQECSDSVELAREVHREIAMLFKRKHKADMGLNLHPRRIKNNSTPHVVTQIFMQDSKADSLMSEVFKPLLPHVIIQGVLNYFKNRQIDESLH